MNSDRIQQSGLENTRKPPFPEKAAALRDRFLRVRKATEALAAPLSEEDCALQSMPDASPVKWHLAHTTWFFETFVLEVFEPHFKAFDPAFRVLFNLYYNAEKHPRPNVASICDDLGTVRAYREVTT